ncbi:MAG: hypothetical protein ABIV10_08090 [Gemmatimonadaceae bacterium]
MQIHRVAIRVAACCGVAMLVGCGKSDGASDSDAKKAADSAAAANAAGAMTPTPMAGASLALSDIAGKWMVRSVPQGGTDTTATEFTLTATGTTEGWTFAYKNGLTVPVRVMVAGDSVVTDAGPHKSVRRKGVDVTTHGSFRKDGDKIVGTTMAKYNTKGADSTLTLRTEGVRIP